MTSEDHIKLREYTKNLDNYTLSAIIAGLCELCNIDFQHLKMYADSAKELVDEELHG